MPKTIVTRRKAGTRTSVTDQINEQRGQLFQAQAIVRCVRLAAASSLAGFDETDITFALAAADRIIDNAASALELVGVRHA